MRSHPRGPSSIRHIKRHHNNKMMLLKQGIQHRGERQNNNMIKEDVTRVVLFTHTTTSTTSSHQQHLGCTSVQNAGPTTLPTAIAIFATVTSIPAIGSVSMCDENRGELLASSRRTQVREYIDTCPTCSAKGLGEKRGRGLTRR